MSSEIDVLVFSNLKNNMTNDDFPIYIPNSQIPDITTIDNFLTNTTIKRSCCNPRLNRKVPIRIPLTDDIRKNQLSNLTSSDPPIKYNYYDKYVNVPQELCSAYPDYTFDPNDTGGNSTCDNFYRGYCANILKEYYTLVGADKDPSKYDAIEFAKYKPECACFALPPALMTASYGKTDEGKYFLGHPECWGSDQVCSVNGYVPKNNRGACQFKINECVQNLLLKVGSARDVTAENIQLVNNCTQNNVDTPLGTPGTPGTPGTGTGTTTTNTVLIGIIVGVIVLIIVIIIIVLLR